MKINVKKYAYINATEIFIKQIDCMKENIGKLINAFEFEKNIEIEASVSFSENEDISLKKIEELKQGHKAVFQKGKHSNGLFKLIAPLSECKDFLIDVFNFDVEYVAIYSGKDESILEQDLSYDMCRRLIKQKRLSVFIIAAIDDSEIIITIGKDFYDVKQIVSKIKETLD